MVARKIGLVVFALTLLGSGVARAQACDPANPATCSALYSAVCYPHTCTFINAPPYVMGYFCIAGTMAGAGTACEDEGNACTSNNCDGSGNCTHAATPGAACTNDGNPCTTDVCDGAANCTHNNATGGSACGASCIAAGTCCNNPNSCTGGRVCSGLGGSCGCPGGTFDCQGSCISNSTCCNSPNTCSGGMVCSGVGGSCSCPGGTYNCAGTCVSNAACCNNPNNCPPPSSGNGTGVCSGVGGSCSVQCNGGYKTCGGQCIPNAQCCYDSDCPNDTVNHRHGVCAAGGACTYACDGGYKPCGGTCIPLANCCNNTDCMAPPNVCYQTAGTCTSGACSYPYSDGTACNADNDKCTPNDKCASGACVPDSAHVVKCLQRPCHTAPACNKSTGNCDDASVSNGTACGGDSCAVAGTCTGGTCSSAIKDCSSVSTDCTTGACDGTLPLATNCVGVNVSNGTTCALGDKCMQAPACSGGTCVGTPKSCTASGACRVAMCNPSTGDCEETMSPVGTSCTPDNTCVQNAQCDATGACVGDTVPDGTPCFDKDCADSATCVTSQCVCLSRPDFGGELVPLTPGDDADMSVTEQPKKSGCEMGGSAPTGAGLAFGLFLLLAFTTRRARVRVRK